MEMIVEGQIVKIKWNGRNKQHFISKGYVFTKLGDEFEVNPLELTKGSSVIIKVKCDYCNKIKDVVFNQFYDQIIKHNLDKYCCKECNTKKISELHKIQKRGFKYARVCDKDDNRGIIYEINDTLLQELNHDQLILINEVKRFCEENNKFPTEKEMTNKNGYVSRTQFYKSFNTQIFIDIYKYIYPLQMEIRNKEIRKIQKKINKPKTIKCRKCKIEKEFTNENFPIDKDCKYGLKRICRKCQYEYSFYLRYKNKGIIFNKWEDITPEQWWEYLYEGKIGYLPNFCFKEENIIKIVRYVFLDKLNLTKKEICEFYTKKLNELKIYHLYRVFHNKLNFLNTCFPELNIGVYDLVRSLNASEEDKINFVDEWMINNRYTINDILNCQYSKDQINMDSFVVYNFGSYLEMFTWYFYKKNIKHPITNKEITNFDFRNKPKFYYASDGAKCNSNEEVKIYEFVKFKLGIENIKAIGTGYNENYIFKLPENSEDKWYEPDFIIEGNDPLFIEYFGLYKDDPKENKMLLDYKNRTLRKINFYNTLSFKFMYLFPEDVRDSLDGLNKKFKEFGLIND